MVGAQQFSLRWNNYSQHLITAFDSLRNDDELTDVTLSCEGKRLKGHRLLLSACSLYFKEIFKENPCKHPVVILKNVSFSDLQSVISFIYNGHVNVTQENLSSFLQTAEYLQIKGLTDMNNGTTTTTTEKKRPISNATDGVISNKGNGKIATAIPGANSLKRRRVLPAALVQQIAQPQKQSQDQEAEEELKSTESGITRAPESVSSASNSNDVEAFAEKRAKVEHDHEEGEADAESDDKSSDEKQQSEMLPEDDTTLGHFLASGVGKDQNSHSGASSDKKGFFYRTLWRTGAQRRITVDSNASINPSGEDSLDSSLSYGVDNGSNGDGSRDDDYYGSHDVENEMLDLRDNGDRSGKGLPALKPIKKMNEQYVVASGSLIRDVGSISVPLFGLTSDGNTSGLFKYETLGAGSILRPKGITKITAALPPMMNETGPYVCDICQKTYAHHRSLNDHKKSHTGATFCHICQRSFSKVANLRAHMLAQHKE